MDRHGWHDRFEEAGSIDEMVAAVRQYAGVVAGASPRLPTGCRADRIQDDDDIDSLTWRLADLSREHRDDAALQQAFAHFLHASLRIARMRRDLTRQVVAGAPFRASRQMA